LKRKKGNSVPKIVAEVVHLSPTYGAMFQLLSTLANSIPVYVKNMATDIYGQCLYIHSTSPKIIEKL
jgi:hypothetical protein